MSAPVLGAVDLDEQLTIRFQMELTKDLGERLSEGGYRLVIVDSIMALYRVDYSGRGELSERQQKVGLERIRADRRSAQRVPLLARTVPRPPYQNGRRVQCEFNLQDRHGWRGSLTLGVTSGQVAILLTNQVQCKIPGIWAF